MLNAEDEEALAARKEHAEVLQSIRSILMSSAGRTFFKYLLRNFDVGELPELGMSGELLADRLGFLRAGNSVFKLLAEVDPAEAGMLLGQIEREKYEKKLRDYLRQNP